MITKSLRKSHSNDLVNLNKIFSGEINADLIINGSSKAWYQVSPHTLDSVLNSNSYNLGMSGTEFIPQKLVYDLYLKYNKKPKIVIQIVDNNILKKNQELYGYMKFVPYLDNNEIKKVTKTYKGFSFPDYYIPFSRYCGKTNFNFVINEFLNIVSPDLKKGAKYKGYLGENKNWDNSFYEFTKINKDKKRLMKMDIQSMQLFENYIVECKKNKINIFLVYPPHYYKYYKYIKNQDEIISYYKKISKKYQVPFLDYSNDVISCSTEYFYNSQHLNKKGAELFTKVLARDILEEIKLKTLKLN